MTLNFEQFMHQVDCALRDECGLSHEDLADFRYADAFADECDPVDVAQEVLEENDFPFE